MFEEMKFVIKYKQYGLIQTRFDSNIAKDDFKGFDFAKQLDFEPI
jgi:hypothetical protein